MLKSTIDRPAIPAKGLMALAILKGYLKHPLWFLTTSILTLPRFSKTVPDEFPREFVRAAALQAWIYIRLKKRLGQQKAYEVVRAMVLPIGLALQQGNFRCVEAGRRFENLVTYQQRTNREGVTRWNTMKVLEQTTDRYEIQVSRCLYFEFFNTLGIPEMTRMMCAVDNAIFNSYQPEELIFHRQSLGNRIVDGAETCRFIIERPTNGPMALEI